MKVACLVAVVLLNAGCSFTTGSSSNTVINDGGYVGSVNQCIGRVCFRSTGSSNIRVGVGGSITVNGVPAEQIPLCESGRTYKGVCKYYN